MRLRIVGQMGSLTTCKIIRGWHAISLEGQFDGSSQKWNPHSDKIAPSKTVVSQGLKDLGVQVGPGLPFEVLN